MSLNFFLEQAKDIRCVNLVKCEETIGPNQFCFWVLSDTQCVSHHTAAIKMASMRAFLKSRLHALNASAGHTVVEVMGLSSGNGKRGLKVGTTKE